MGAVARLWQMLRGWFGGAEAAAGPGPRPVAAPVRRDQRRHGAAPSSRPPSQNEAFSPVVIPATEEEALSALRERVVDLASWAHTPADVQLLQLLDAALRDGKLELPRLPDLAAQLGDLHLPLGLYFARARQLPPAVVHAIAGHHGPAGLPPEQRREAWLVWAFDQMEAHAASLGERERVVEYDERWPAEAPALESVLSCYGATVPLALLRLEGD